jgi:6-phosphogluconolactonase
MANELLFSFVDIPAENIHRIKGENDPEEEALRYSGEIRKNLTQARGSYVFDLIILGMGEDGHTASIFPDNLGLIDDKRLCAVARHPSSELKRVTLTGSVIKNARKIFFMVTGTNKANRVSEIMNNEETAKLLPAYYIEPAYGTLIWFIDEAAASQIS